MKTEILEPNEENLKKSAELIRKGGIVCFPTETVYGLGGSAYNSETVADIFAAKGRPNDNPLIVHIGDKRDIYSVVSDVPLKARILMEKLWPAPLTMILPKNKSIVSEVTGGLDTVGVRMPAHEKACEFFRLCKVPVVGPSANTSTRPSPTSAEHVYADMNGKIPVIIDGGKCLIGIESTVIDMTKKTPVIYRPGFITPEDLEPLIGETVYALKPPEGGRVASPGMKYRHYAPLCDMELLPAEELLVRAGEFKKKGLKAVLLAKEGVMAEDCGYPVYVMGPNDISYASLLYKAFRDCEKDFDVILAQSVSEEGVGRALMNRLKKAAALI